MDMSSLSERVTRVESSIKHIETTLGDIALSLKNNKTGIDLDRLLGIIVKGIIIFGSVVGLIAYIVKPDINNLALKIESLEARTSTIHKTDKGGP